MSTFDDFMIGEAVDKNQQIAKLERDLATAQARIATLSGILQELYGEFEGTRAINTPGLSWPDMDARVRAALEGKK